MGGRSDGLKVDRGQFEAALGEYYRQSGWDLHTGVSTRQTLERLGLRWVANDLDL